MTDSRPPVVLVHGIWLSGWVMGFIARHLRGCGFRTYYFSYPTVRNALGENAAALRAFTDRIAGDVLHFVGHSLGGVVIQTMLAHCPPARGGRVVTLCSPHAGTRAGAALARWGWGRRITGRSVADLLRGAAYPADLGGREVGLIRGNHPFGLGRLFVRFDVPNDGVVALDEMRWPGAVDQIALPVSHTGVLFSRRAAANVCHFLRFGRFAR
ncbi:MAG TPA: alpha/beta fold hydrolase [Burkholderiales bacterium]